MSSVLTWNVKPVSSSVIETTKLRTMPLRPSKTGKSHERRKPVADTWLMVMFTGGLVGAEEEVNILYINASISVLTIALMTDLLQAFGLFEQQRKAQC